MARNNATVTYVEPNDIYDSLDRAAGGNIHYDRAPDLEDYCIAMNIGVEVSSREDALRKQESANKVLIMCYRDDGNKSTVSFMSGSKLGGYTKDKNGNQVPRLNNTYNAMTSYPLDMYVTDLVDYGTTELIGIKSVNIDYNSGYIPKIKLVMTDVRGMSLFQPKELNYDNSFNGIRGLSKDNIAQTFFQCFFTLPLPKFTIQVKGFYGRPVTYQMMCEKFNTNFDSATGNFDVEADFIGYGFSFMSDIAFDALLAAPYSDYNGESYWNSQIEAGRFVIPDKTGQHQMPMPRLYDIRKNFAELFNDTNNDFQINSLSNEERTHNDEITKLGQLKEDIRSWYLKLYEILKNKYGEKLVYLFENGDLYERILLLGNAKDNPSGDLGELYKQLDASFRDVHQKLYASIEEFNKNGITLKNISKDFTDYSRERIFRKLYINVNNSQIVFDGFDPDCELPRKRTIDTVFPNGNDANKLRKLYNDGVNQYIYGFIIELDYQSVENRLKALLKDSNMSDDEKTKREKIRAYNQSMFAKMNWYPTIENFTKITMAHLETLMHMMYAGAQAADGRTVQDMGLSLDNLSDVPAKNKTISLFPRITKLVTGDDGIVKKEDAWIGEFKLKGDKVPEVDIINGLFNGISEIHRLETEIRAQIEENNRGEVVVPTDSSVVKYPTTPYDFYITKNIYGDGNVTDLYSFIGKICVRMFNVLATNTFRYQYNDWSTVEVAKLLGELEAVNFHELNRIRNSDVFKAISSGGIYDNADKILTIVTNTDTQDNLPEMPWGKKPLLNSKDLWLDRYHAGNSWIYPVQNVDFQELEEIQKQIFDGVYTNENEDIILSDVANYYKLLSNYLNNRTSDNAFFNMFIEEDRTRFETYLNKANGGGDNYSDISEKYIRESISYSPDEVAKLFNVKEKTSFNETLTGSNKPELGARKSVGEFHNHKAEEDNICIKYKIEDSTVIDFLSMDNNSIPNKCVITEVFGYKKNGEEYVIDTDKSFFMCDKNEMGNADLGDMTNQEKEMTFFIMGVKGFNYSGLNAYKTKKAFAYIPKTIVLQIGAVLRSIYNTSGETLNNVFTNETFKKLRKRMPLPEGFEGVAGFLNEMNPMGRMYLAKYFKKWAETNYSRISHFYVERKRNNNKNNEHDYKTKSVDCHLRFFINDDAGYYKTILNQNSVYTKELTSDLLAPVILVRGNVNGFRSFVKKNGKLVNEPLSRKPFLITRDMAKEYINSFLEKLRSLYNIGEETGNLTTQAKTADKTTDDMKMELYRYLKQIYDKWIPTVNFDDWKFETFFGEKDCVERNFGHQFHFIDSYFNKTNTKILINPRELSEKIGASISYTDINVMMHTFLSDVYAQHRCMLRCVQNFADLGNYSEMKDMFRPLPYNEMGSPKIHPDFVVVYTYEPSKNLNIDNGEFKDDGFMLNEEMDTPMAIRTRMGKDGSSYYQIPAFGVSYGKQYQNYFKNVSVNMASPIQTQQSLIAKHAILRASHNDKSKTVTAQDLYDIYSTQSYTCNVEMMGCAWVQPMMYFVLLNIPMFRGSYMIMKVNHKITPGNMTTTFTGCRMANVGNRFIEDIFSDEEPNGALGSEPGVYQEAYADIDNNCKYKVYPLIENHDDYNMSGNELSKAQTLMKYLTETGASEMVAAGIVGNMFQESTLNPTAQNANSSASGLIQWLGNNLGAMLQNDFKEYWYKKYSLPSKQAIKERLSSDRGAKFQCEFIVKSMRDNNHPKFRTLWTTLHNKSTAADVAEEFCRVYEAPGTKEAHIDNRRKAATRYWNNRNNNSTPSNTQNTTDASLTNENIYKLLFDAIQKSLYSSNLASVKIKYEYNGKDEKNIIKPMIITQHDGKNDKLSYVFDIILNSESYYKHVQNLYWIANGGAEVHHPDAIVVEAALQPDNSKKHIYVAKLNGKKPDNINNKFTYKSGDSKPVSEKMLLSLVKHYGAIKDNKHFITDCPQFATALEMFDDITINDCNDIMGNTMSSLGVEISKEVTNPLMKKVLAHTNIYCHQHNYGKESEWRTVKGDKGPYPATGKGWCTFGPSTWYAFSDVNEGEKPKPGSKHDLRFYPGPETATHENTTLGNYGFKLIWHGTIAQALRLPTSSFKPGDISTQYYKTTDGKNSAHGCMFTGKDWRSDFVQRTIMANTKFTDRDGEYSVCIWRNPEYQ